MTRQTREHQSHIFKQSPFISNINNHNIEYAILPNDSLQKGIPSVKYDEWNLFLHLWRLSSNTNLNPTLENNNHQPILLDHNVIE